MRLPASAGRLWRALMRAQRLFLSISTVAVVAGVALAQPGRGGGSQWLTALADAQRTSWIRTDDKISTAALAKPGFDAAVDDRSSTTSRADSTVSPRASRPPASRSSSRCRSSPAARTTSTASTTISVTSSGSGTSTRRSAPATGACGGGLTSAATRIVRADGYLPTAFGGFGGGPRRGRISKPARRTR